MPIPKPILAWFAQRNWKMHAYQKSMFAAFQQGLSTLLLVPTGGGKTLASFLPSLYHIHTSHDKGLHTLYISPLKALTYDIQRNLAIPIKEMNLKVTLDARTGDTSSYRRIKQRKKPPHILLTTPESLMLLLSYEDAANFFSTVKVIIIDELHSFINSKRGDLTSLALSRLAQHAPHHFRFGLSATVADTTYFSCWLGTTQKAAQILQTTAKCKPKIALLSQEAAIPYCGHMAKYAIPGIYDLICKNKITLVFVNTRAQAEFIFQEMWDINKQKLPIAIYHGSLNKELRTQTVAMAAAGEIRALITTSALELGIDWGNVDCVVQIGAPKGISRLLQRIGRANHQFDQASHAFLAPANCFEVLECHAAMQAIAENQLDGEVSHAGSLDVVIQFILNCACSAPISANDLYQQICHAYPYRTLTSPDFERLLAFATQGGYVLQHYPQYHRLILNPDGAYTVQSPLIRRRHRQNIGTIIEAAKLKVKRLRGRGGRILGEIEEHFIQQLIPGDTFLFGGEVVTFIRIKDMLVEVKGSPDKQAKIPSYRGGNMPLSTYLAARVLQLINDTKQWKMLPKKTAEWLKLQQLFSLLPPLGKLLIEHFPRKKIKYSIVYHFAGRRANYTLAIIMTRRMESLQLHPLSFTATDYGIAISSLKTVSEQQMKLLLAPDIFKHELEEWLKHSPAVKRAFRHVAIIAGLIGRQLAHQRKTMKQVTFSTDLIYDVLLRHEPQHILLTISRNDVERDLLDIHKLMQMLQPLTDNILFKPLSYPSPLSLPILLAIKTETLKGAAEDELLTLAATEEEAVRLIAEVRSIVQ